MVGGTKSESASAAASEAGVTACGRGKSKRGSGSVRWVLVLEGGSAADYWWKIQVVEDSHTVGPMKLHLLSLASLTWEGGVGALECHQPEGRR